MEYNRIINDDCIKTMLLMPNTCIDLLITSPPYALNLEYEKGLTLEGLHDLVVSMLKGAYRVLKDDGRIVLIYGDQILERVPMQPYYMQWITEAGFVFECARIWVKPFARLNFNHQMYRYGLPFREWETIWVINKGKPREVNNKRVAIRGCFFSEGGNSGVDKNRHPAAYPETLVENILDIYSKQEDIVLDPFLGSGTTAVVCQRLNRRYLGIELNKEYCEIALSRLSKEKKQTRLLEQFC